VSQIRTDSGGPDVVSEGARPGTAGNQSDGVSRGRLKELKNDSSEETVGNNDGERPVVAF
jgi:hypothetical protein